MKKAAFVVVVLLCAAPLSVKAGRGNMVHHINADGSEKVFLASQGNCVHHLTAHPGDYVPSPDGVTKLYSPADCN